MAEQLTTGIDLVALVGAVAAGEYEAAKDFYKPGLLEWAGKMRSLSDAEFLTDAKCAIFDSASCNRFRGNWEHEHFKATACWFEAKRRHIAAGHDEDCRGETLYSRAHASVMRDHGYAPTEPGECCCEGLNGG